MSGDDVPYQLRPNKWVERMLFVDLLSFVRGWNGPVEYVYASMGGRTLEDFKLINDYFDIHRMISVEISETTFERQKINKPLGCIECYRASAGELGSKFDKYFGGYPDASLIVWLDYANANQRGAQLSELGSMVPNLRSGDVLKVTLNCRPDSFRERSYPLTERDYERFLRDRIPEATGTFGEYVSIQAQKLSRREIDLQPQRPERVRLRPTDEPESEPGDDIDSGHSGIEQASRTGISKPASLDDADAMQREPETPEEDVPDQRSAEPTTLERLSSQADGGDAEVVTPPQSQSIQAEACDAAQQAAPESTPSASDEEATESRQLRLTSAEYHAIVTGELRVQLRDHTFADGLSAETIRPDRFPAFLAEGVRSVLLDGNGADRTVEILPLAIYTYADGRHRMLTVTCLVADSALQEKAESDRNFQRWEFRSRTWTSIYNIQVPDLSRKECGIINGIYKPGMTAKEVHDLIGFKLHDNPERSVKLLAAYLRHYRHYPAFERIR